MRELKSNDEASLVLKARARYCASFYIFADTGAGDLWFLGLDDGKVAFYDHDASYLYASNLIKVDLDVAGRLRLPSYLKNLKYRRAKRPRVG